MTTTFQTRLADAQLPLQTNGIVAWSQAHGLIAIAGSLQPSSKATVAILDPSCPDEFCEIQPNLGASDSLVSLSWTPPGTRHVLLTASQHGTLAVWTQVPPDSQGTPQVPCVNQWFGHTLTTSVTLSGQPSAAPPPPQPTMGMHDLGHLDAIIQMAVNAVDVAPPPVSSGGAGGLSGSKSSAQLVHAQFLSQPPTCHWSQAKLSSISQPLGTLDDLFAVPLNRPSDQVEVRHWLRQSLLCIAVVDSEAGLRFWWANMGRHPSHLQWLSSTRVILLPPNPNTPPPNVTAAATLAASGGCVQVAVITSWEPNTITLCSVRGDPTISMLPGLPNDRRLHANVLARIDLTVSLVNPTLSPTLTVEMALCGGQYTGTTMYVLVGEKADKAEDFLADALGETDLLLGSPAADATHTSHLMVFRQPLQQMFPPTTATLIRSIHTPSPPHGLCVSPDGSKVAWLNDTTLHVVSTEDLNPIAEELLDLTPSTETTTKTTSTTTSQGGATGQSLEPVPPPCLAFSPLGCALCVLGGKDLVGWRHVGDGSSTGMNPITPGSRLQILPILDIPTGRSHASIFHPSRLPTTSSPPPQEPLIDPTWEVHARLEAARMAWCTLENLPVWCLGKRSTALGHGCIGWSPTFRSLCLFDDMVHHEESHPRPSYAAMADRVKLCVLSGMPGTLPTAIIADIVTRQLLVMVHQTLTPCVQLNLEQGTQRAIFTQEMANVKTCLSWLSEYCLLMLSSVKAWSQALSKLPQYDQTRAQHVSTAGFTEQSFAQASVAVAVEEGPGAAWAYWQEAHEAGGPLSPQEAASALPCLRLWMDRKVITNLRYCIQVWSQIRSRQPPGDDQGEDSAQMRHEIATKMKQLQAPLEGVLALNVPRPDPNVPATMAMGNQAPQPNPKELAAILPRLYPGRVQLHAGRCTLLANTTHLQPLFTSPPVMSAPILTPRQILARARDLGLLMAPKFACGPGADIPISVQVLSTWTQYRRTAPSLSAHAPLLLAPHPIGPGIGGPSGAGGGAAATNTVDILQSLVTPGTVGVETPGMRGGVDTGASGNGGDGGGAGERGAEALRRRWRRQRAVALGAADPSQVHSSVRMRSRVAAAVEEARCPVLDMLAMTRMEPRSTAWSVEAVDGGTATSLLDDEVLAVTVASNSVHAVKRTWIGACPLTGVGWKRVRPVTGRHDMVPDW